MTLAGRHLATPTPAFTFTRRASSRRRATYECSIDGTAVGTRACTHAADDRHAARRDGTHTYTVRAIDGLANAGAAVEHPGASHLDRSTQRRRRSPRASSSSERHRRPTRPSSGSPRPTDAHGPITYQPPAEHAGRGNRHDLVRRVPVHDRLDDPRRRHRRRRLHLHRDRDGRSYGNQSTTGGIIVTIDGGAPSVPGNVHAVAALTGSAPVISWNASTGQPATYRVFRDGVNDRHRQRAGDDVQRRDAAARRNARTAPTPTPSRPSTRRATRARRAPARRSCSTRVRPLPAAALMVAQSPTAGEAGARLAGLRQHRPRRLQRLPRRREAQRRRSSRPRPSRTPASTPTAPTPTRCAPSTTPATSRPTRLPPACSTTRPLRAPPAARPWRLRAAARPRSAGRLPATPVRESPPTRCVARPRTAARRRASPRAPRSAGSFPRPRAAAPTPASPRVRATATPCSRSTRSATSRCRVRRRRSRSRARPTRRPPKTPTALHAVLSDGQITLTWKNPKSDLARVAGRLEREARAALVHRRQPDLPRHRHEGDPQAAEPAGGQAGALRGLRGRQVGQRLGGCARDDQRAAAEPRQPPRERQARRQPGPHLERRSPARRTTTSRSSRARRPPSASASRGPP